MSDRDEYNSDGELPLPVAMAIAAKDTVICVGWAMVRGFFEVTFGEHGVVMFVANMFRSEHKN